eukprot:scaffold2585_cov368-Prasinococcus_capsulatus_cf.AAC.5
MLEKARAQDMAYKPAAAACAAGGACPEEDVAASGSRRDDDWPRLQAKAHAHMAEVAALSSRRQRASLARPLEDEPRSPQRARPASLPAQQQLERGALSWQEAAAEFQNFLDHDSDMRGVSRSLLASYDSPAAHSAAATQAHSPRRSGAMVPQHAAVCAQPATAPRRAPTLDSVGADAVLVARVRTQLLQDVEHEQRGAAGVAAEVARMPVVDVLDLLLRRVELQAPRARSPSDGTLEQRLAAPRPEWSSGVQDRVARCAARLRVSCLEVEACSSSGRAAEAQAKLRGICASVEELALELLASCSAAAALDEESLAAAASPPLPLEASAALAAGAAAGEARLVGKVLLLEAQHVLGDELVHLVVGARAKPALEVLVEELPLGVHLPHLGHELVPPGVEVAHVLARGGDGALGPVQAEVEGTQVLLERAEVVDVAVGARLEVDEHGVAPGGGRQGARVLLADADLHGVVGAHVLLEELAQRRQHAHAVLVVEGHLHVGVPDPHVAREQQHLLVPALVVAQPAQREEVAEPGAAALQQRQGGAEALHALHGEAVLEAQVEPEGQLLRAGLVRKVRARRRGARLVAWRGGRLVGAPHGDLVEGGVVHVARVGVARRLLEPDAHEVGHGHAAQLAAQAAPRRALQHHLQQHPERAHRGAHELEERLAAARRHHGALRRHQLVLQAVRVDRPAVQRAAVRARHDGAAQRLHRHAPHRRHRQPVQRQVLHQVHDLDARLHPRRHLLLVDVEHLRAPPHRRHPARRCARQASAADGTSASPISPSLNVRG